MLNFNLFILGPGHNDFACNEHLAVRSNFFLSEKNTYSNNEYCLQHKSFCELGKSGIQ